MRDVVHTTLHALSMPPAVCPRCGRRALLSLSPVERQRLGDGTTLVCHPSIGGCDRGFRVGG